MQESAEARRGDWNYELRPDGPAWRADGSVS